MVKTIYQYTSVDGSLIYGLHTYNKATNKGVIKYCHFGNLSEHTNNSSWYSTFRGVTSVNTFKLTLSY